MARRADFEIRIDDKEVYKAVRRLLSTMDDLRPTLLKPLVYPALLDAEKEHFEGGNFAPLSARYAKWKAAHAPGQRILQYTGGLMASFTEQKAKGQSTRYEKARITFASNWPTAHLHQAGRGSRLPSRPPLAPYPLINTHLENAYRQWASELESQWGRGA